MKTPGDMIRYARREAGLTLQALGTKLGVSQSFISNLEQGRDALPQRLISALTDILHIDETDLHEAIASWHAAGGRRLAQSRGRHPRLRTALLKHVRNAEELRSALRGNREHPVDQQIIAMLSAVLDELMVNWVPELESLWDKYRRLGLVDPNAPRNLTAIYGYIVSHNLWDDVALAVLSSYPRDLGIGYGDRAETAARLWPYLAGVPLRWRGFEDAAEYSLMRNGCPSHIINQVLKRSSAWETSPTVSDPRFQDQVNSLWLHRRLYLQQVGLANPDATLTTFDDLLTDSAFCIDGLFKDFWPTSILLDELTFDPARVVLKMGSLTNLPTPLFSPAFLEVRRRLFADGEGTVALPHVQEPLEQQAQPGSLYRAGA